MTGGVSSIVAVSDAVPGGLASLYVTVIVPLFTTLSNPSPGLLAPDVSWTAPANTPEAFPISVAVTVSLSPVSLLAGTVAGPLRALSLKIKPPRGDDTHGPSVLETLA